MAGRETGRPMVARRGARVPGFARPELLKSAKAKALLWAGLGAVVATALLTPVNSGPAKTGAVVIPPPAASVNGRQVLAGAVAGAGPAVRASLPARATPTASPAPAATFPPVVSPPPVAGAGYAGQVLLTAAGSQVASWNQTSTFCPQDSWQVADGTVSTDHSDDAVLATTGVAGSCVAAISPGAYSSAVIEAYIYFPPVPGKPDTIADWTSFWLTDQATWPTGGELDAVEAEPATGVNAVAWHWGTSGSPMAMSTDGFAPDGSLPADGPNLTPGWHVVDIVYTKGFFAVYYDGKEYTSLSSAIVTGAPLNILITSSVTPDTSQIQQELGNSPQNSDSSPAGIAVKYVKIWSFN
jgi:hypothetical protein